MDVKKLNGLKLAVALFISTPLWHASAETIHFRGPAIPIAKSAVLSFYGKPGAITKLKLDLTRPIDVTINTIGNNDYFQFYSPRGGTFIYENGVFETNAIYDDDPFICWWVNKKPRITEIHTCADADTIRINNAAGKYLKKYGPTNRFKADFSRAVRGDPAGLRAFEVLVGAN